MRRLLGKLFPFFALAVVVLGIFAAETVIYRYARAPVPLAEAVWPAVLIFLGAVLLLLCIYERRLATWLERDEEMLRELDAIEKDVKALKRAEGLEESTAPPTPAAPGNEPSRAGTLLKARDFLPDEMPEGWTRPLAVGGSFRWMFDTPTECVALVLERERWMMAVKVFIVGKGTREPVTDARCAAILAHVRHVTEFIEMDPSAEHPEGRSWIAVPTGLRPRWKVPKSIPGPRERVLSPHLVAARKYLPQKLPQGWSVPVAIGDDHGTEWKDGAWMIATPDDRFMVVCLVTSKGRVKLSVTFFGADASEVSEGAAVDMLRHFRGVLEFAQTEATAEAEEVPTRTYLGELAPEGGTRVLLN